MKKLTTKEMLDASWSVSMPRIEGEPAHIYAGMGWVGMSPIPTLAVHIAQCVNLCRGLPESVLAAAPAGSAADWFQVWSALPFEVQTMDGDKAVDWVKKEIQWRKVTADRRAEIAAKPKLPNNMIVVFGGLGKSRALTAMQIFSRNSIGAGKELALDTVTTSAGLHQALMSGTIRFVTIDGIGADNKGHITIYDVIKLARDFPNVFFAVAAYGDALREVV